MTEMVCADASKLTPERLEEAAREGARRHGLSDWTGEIDAIVGGPPCQGFSTIGKRLVDDTRNRLVFDFYRLVTALRPRYFVMENVPGMAAGGHSAILDTFVNEFRKAGYEVEAKVLSAADFGVPQLRRRLIVLGTRRDQIPALHPEPFFNPVPKTPGSKVPVWRSDATKGPTVWEAIGDLPDLERFSALAATDEVRLPSRTLASMERRASDYATAMRGRDRQDLSHPRHWDKGLLTSSARTAHTATSVERFASTSPGDTEPVSRFYRLHPAGLCNTLRAGTGSERGAFTSPRPIHPKLSRVISVREAARLHSMPDWFRLHATKWHGFRQIGNAVAPRMGRAVAEAVVGALQVTPSLPRNRVTLGETQLLNMTMKEATEYYGVDRADVPAPRSRPDYQRVAA